LKLIFQTSSATDVAAETEYAVKAIAPGGTIVDSSVTFKLTVKQACITALALGANPLKDIVYYIDTTTAQPLQFDLPTYTPTPAACTEPIMKWVYIGTDATYLQPIPSWFTGVPSGTSFKMQISTKNASDAAAETEYKVVAFNNNMTVKEESAKFKVTLKVPCTTGLTLTTAGVVDTVYHINTTTATTTLLDVPTYTQAPVSCSDPQTLTIHPTSNLNGAAPGYLTIVESNGT